MQTLSLAATEQVRPELSPTEHLLWSGQPYQGLMLRPSDLYQIPFSLMWCGFAIFWEVGVTTAPHAPVFMSLWGIPFVAIGLYMVAGRFFVESWQRARTSYALTDERVIIVSGLFGRKVQSLPLRLLPQLTLDLRDDGSGTLQFTTQETRGWASTWASWPYYNNQPPAFERIANARAVQQMLREAQGRALPH